MSDDVDLAEPHETPAPEPSESPEPAAPPRPRRGLPTPVAVLIILAGLVAAWTVYQSNTATSDHRGAWELEVDGVAMNLNFDANGDGLLITPDNQPFGVPFQWKAKGRSITCYPDNTTQLPLAEAAGQPITYTVSKSEKTVTLSCEAGSLTLNAPFAPSPPGG